MMATLMLAPALRWVFYMAGQMLHMLKRSDMTHGKRGEFFRRNWVALTVRVFLGTLLFMSPALLMGLMGRFGVVMGFQLPSDPLSALAIAGAVGFFADSMLDWIAAKVPFLQGEIPVYQNGGGQ